MVVFHIIVWVLIIALFIASFAGLIFPIIPSSLLIWVGFLLYHFAIDSHALGLFFWIAMAILTLILFGSDMLANSYFVEKSGGGKWAKRLAAVGVIIGAFILPPFGIIIVPFLAVLIVELLQQTPAGTAIKIATGSLIGFLGGTFAKFLIQLVMIGVFVFTI
ncbi:DUF456 family protein [Virgibacillus sp. 179-BFC.A HS]|uniref:DUF456 family protein n=1 Tax=Tigheibacillus jepli TaxID=3035914 RepID=A0ABU5CKS2_9BACI|nr:DUF456 family protein [Virgibacillus sp. 179-BFC.A HS]MDY0406954.1 DUF456 family protein [Virgibacillus sp. 179-BFC.A HS]